MLGLGVPKVFCVPITDKCHLRCDFCFNSDEYFSSAKHMAIEDFKRIVDWLISQGITQIDITPAVGEALLIPNLEEFLDYLDSSSISKYLLITSLAVKDIDVLKGRRKLVLEVSLYGGSAQQYLHTTKRDVYNIVAANIEELVPEGITILKRFEGLIKDTRFRILTKLDSVKLIDYSENRGLNSSGKGDRRKCLFMNEPLVTKKGISLCCKDYKISDLVIGQVGDSLDQVYSKLTLEDAECSTRCDWFKEWEPSCGLD